MKLIFLIAATLFAVGLTTAAGADTLQEVSIEAPQGDASQLLLPEQEASLEVEYDSDRLNTLENNINQSVSGEDSNQPNIIRPPSELGLPSEVIIIDSDGGPAVGTEL